MNLSSLQIFVAVGRLGSFSKAAVALGIAQPSVSRVIGDLERHFGGPLFYRTGRGVTLTDLGEIALPRAKALVREADQLTEEVHTFRDSPSGLVVLGVLPSIVTPLAADVHVELRERFPGIRLRIFEGFSNQVECWLAEGTVDIGLLSRYGAADQDQADLLFVEELALVSRALDAPQPGTVRFMDAVRLPLVLAAEPNGLRISVEAAARRNGLSLNVVVEADSLSAQRDLVLRGYHSFMSAHAVTEDRESGRIHAASIVGPAVRRQVVLTTTRQRPLSRASKVVLETIRFVAQRTAGMVPRATPDPRPPARADGRQRPCRANPDHGERILGNT